VLAANVVLRQVDTLTLVVAVVGWFLAYELKVAPQLPQLYTQRHSQGARSRMSRP
jgi:uncharacterized membrane protein